MRFAFWNRNEVEIEGRRLPEGLAQRINAPDLRRFSHAHGHLQSSKGLEHLKSAAATFAGL